MPENKFKAGDRLVAKHDVGRIRAGDVVVVESQALATKSYAWVRIVGYRDSTVDGSFREDHFELWQPKVGERVRYTGKDARYSDKYMVGAVATVVGVSTIDADVKWDSGEYYNGGYTGGGKYFGNLEPLPVATAAQPAADAPAAALKIEAGRYYRDADGKKVGPMRMSVSWPTTHPFFEQGELGRWSESGEPCVDSTLRRRAKLIAEWVDEPAAPPAKPIVAATVDYQADEYGSGVQQTEKPKFKVGDWVKRDGWHDFYEVSSIRDGRVYVKVAGFGDVSYDLDDRYTVRPANDNSPVAQQPAAKFKVGDRVRVARCDAGKVDYVGQFGNVTGVDIGGLRSIVVKIDGDIDLHFSAGELELAPAPWSGYGSRVPTAIVARIDNGQPKPNPVPFVHHSQEAAAKEAARLANKHKGQKFGVYVLTGEPAFVEKPTYAHEWQRLAANGNKIAAIRELRGLTGIGLHPAKVAVDQFVAAA